MSIVSQTRNKELLLKKIDSLIEAIKKIIAEFDVVKESVNELSEKAKTDPQAAEKLNKLIEGYTYGEERKLYDSALSKIEKLIETLSPARSKSQSTMNQRNRNNRKIV
uniref:Type III secretion system filament chaperone CesA n=1 Tax=Escherichia coli 3003 TaxID=869692 RepID=UPI0002C86547|nr:Chain A, Type III secretion system filament chaperone CesA [Escherichia coli 3003]2M1N_B Chain B, Type III secretion system filament chaperone CesA [Escherichia coli 3003]